MSKTAERHRRVPASRATIRTTLSVRDRATDALRYGANFRFAR